MLHCMCLYVDVMVCVYLLTYLCLTVINLALNKPARQVSTYAGEVAGKAVDGRYDTRSCTVSNVHPWWTVDLGAAYSVSHVTVTNDGSPGNYRQTYCISKSSTTKWPEVGGL